jgi:uncharacterized membrane protein
MPDEDDLQPTPDPAARVAALEARIQHLEQRLQTLEQRPLPAAQTHVPSPPPLPPPPRPAQRPAIFTASPADTQPSPASLENRLGSQVFNRIGIVAVLLGATLFLKLAAENHWIGPLGRVLIGLLAGAALTLWAERFRRRRFVAFAYSLQAIGSGVLYLSLWAAFQLYHLLPAPAAFALMLAVTAWNAFMALSPGDPSQASELLAVYALAGAFATPLLLSTGGNHPAFLFSYLLVTDLATVALVCLRQRPAASPTAASPIPIPIPISKPWPRLLLIALPATAVYFIAWYLRFYAPDQLLIATLFLTLFFAVFLTIPLAPNAGEPERSDQQPEQGSDHHPEQPSALPFLPDIVLPLANAAFTSLSFYFVLDDAHHHAALPWVALLLAALYLALLRLPQRPAARAIHLSLAVVFLTIAIPLKVSGAAISLAWLAEAVTLLWAAHRFESQAPESAPRPVTPDPLPRLLTLLATGALTLGLLGLLLHPLWIDPEPTTAVLNRRFATALAGILAFAATASIARSAARAAALRQLPEIPEELRPAWREIAAASVIAFNLLALQAGVLEIQTFWLPTATSPTPEAQLQTALSISVFLALYGAALLALGFRRLSAFLRWQALILLLLAIAKTFLYDVRNLSQGYRVASLLGLGALLMAISFAYQRDWLSLRVDPSKASGSD